MAHLHFFMVTTKDLFREYSKRPIQSFVEHLIINKVTDNIYNNEVGESIHLYKYSEKTDKPISLVQFIQLFNFNKYIAVEIPEADFYAIGTRDWQVYRVEAIVTYKVKAIIKATSEEHAYNIATHEVAVEQWEEQARMQGSNMIRVGSIERTESIDPAEAYKQPIFIRPQNGGDN